MLNLVVSDPSIEGDIANLHEALQLLLPPKSDFIRPAGDYDTPAKLERLAGEIKKETVLQLGRRTLEAIELFKLQERLAKPEDSKFTRQRLDQATAEKLNAYLDDLGAFDPPDLRVVYGQVSHVDASGLPGPPALNVPVHVFDDSGSRSLLVASAVSDGTTGQYQASFTFSQTQHRSVGVPDAGGAYLARVDLARGTRKRIRADLLLAGATTSVPFTVHGIVSRATGGASPATLVQGAVVLVYLASQGNRRLASSLPTDALGAYTLSAVAAADARLFVAIEESGAIVASSPLWLNAGGDVARDLMLPASGTSSWVVMGTVRDARGDPLAGLFVRAVDRDLRTEQALGTAVTGSDGSYTIPYAELAFQAAESGTAEIIVRAFPDDDPSTAALCESSLLWNGERVSIVDLTVPTVLADAPSEFERASDAIGPLLQGQGANGANLPAAELNADDERFLARETGLDPAVIASWAESARLVREALALLLPNAPAAHHQALESPGWPFFYGWRRAGLAAGLAGVLNAEPAQWRASEEGAHQRGWIPAPAEPELGVLMQVLAGLQARGRLDPRYTADPVLAAVGAVPVDLPPELVGQAVELFKMQGLSALASFDALGNGDPDLRAGLAALGKTLRVYALVDGDAGLLQPLAGQLNARSDGLEPLAALGAPQWLALVQQGGQNGAQAEHTAATLQVKAEQLHPTNALQARLSGGDLILPGQVAGDVNRLIDLNRSAVDTLLYGGESAGSFAFGNAHPKLAEQFADLGRWVKGGAGLVGGQMLLDLGIKSPGVITNFGPRIIDMILPTLPPAIRDFIKIQQLRFGNAIDRWINTQIDIRPPINSIPPGLSLPTFDPPPPDVAGMSSPTLRGMFGDLDDCVCRPCESVLGQGAYLVDLLNLLKREVLARGQSGASLRTGVDTLRARRPEILDLELNCANAEIQLPHIDLALEALEWLVVAAQLEHSAAAARPIAEWFRPALDASLVALAQRTAVDPVTITSALVDSGNPRLWRVSDGLRVWLFAAEPFAGDATRAKTVRLVGRSIRRTTDSPNPRVAPAHRIPAAYDALGAAVYPWSLPFDLPLAEAREYVECMQLPRQRLLQLNAATSAQAHVDQMLGLSAAERSLLQTSRGGNDLWKVWGYADASPVTVLDPASGETLANQTPQQLLQRVSILLARTGLTLDELEAALASAFVGGLSVSERAQCKTSLMRVTPAASPEALDRLHRLVRLRRKLPGWTLRQVDAALTTLNPLPTPPVRIIDTSVLAGLAHLQDARQRLGLTPEQLLGLRAPLSEVPVEPDGAAAATSLFVSVFMSSRVGAAARALFAGVAQPGQVSGEKIIGHLGSVAAALGVEAPALRPLVDTADAVTHANLTTLYRHTKLARALGVPPADVRLLVALTGIAPLADAAAAAGAATTAERAAGFAALVAFAEAAAKFQDAPLDLALAADAMLPLSDALRAALSPRAGIKSEAQIGTELKSLRAALRAAMPVAATEAALLQTQTEAALGQAVDSGVARRIVYALVAPTPAADAAFVDALSGSAIAARDLFVLPLLTAAEATELLTNTPVRTLAARLGAVLSACGRFAQRAALAAAVGGTSGLSGAILASVLRDRLRVDVTGGVPAEPVRAFLDESFWAVAAGAALPTELVLWAQRLNRLVQLFADIDAELALSVIDTRGWESRILPAAGTGAAQRWPTLEPVLDLCKLARAEELAEGTLRAHVAALDAANAAANLPQAVIPLARRLGLEAATVLGLVKMLTGSAATPTSLRQPAVMRGLSELAAVARPWRATADQMAALSGADAAKLTEAARQLLAARDGPEGWPATLTGISNALRRQQRDALVAHLQQRFAGLAATEGLYEQMLIDPQIQPCLMTTRITQAVASVQLLVQRILFGLEPDLAPSEVLRERWSWMRSYRLWEASRKVFLYPENWLFPELRDDKSPGFRRLEATLSQGELSAERAAQAFGQFLADVDEVGQTQVLGLFEDTDAVGANAPQARTRRDLYMVGRNPNPPYAYHWRTCQDFGKRWMEWSPWERIELDIQGDHVMPFVSSGRVHVAWPLIQKQPATAQSTDTWTIAMAWSHFDGLAWKKVSTSRDGAPQIDKVAFENDRSAFAFRPQTSRAGTSPVIQAYVKTALQGTASTLEPEPEPAPVTGHADTAPQLDAVAGIDKLATLLRAVRSDGAFNEHFRDLLEFWCVRMKATLPWGAGYLLIPLPEVLLDAGKLAWHRAVRKDPFTSPVVDSLTYTIAEVRAFVRDLRAYGYGSTAPYLPGLWTTAPYAAQIQAVLARCASRSVRFRAWVRLRGAGADDLLELQAADGIFELQISGEGTFALAPRASTAPSVQPSLGSATASLVWKPAGTTLRLPATAARTLASVEVGKSLVQTLHFEIDDIANRSGFAARLQSRRTFKQVQRFVLQAAGSMATQAVNGPALEFIDDKSDVWMNGLQETAGASQAYGLTLRSIRGPDVAVFSASAAVSRYWVVGAAAPDATALNQTSIWCFKEGTASCFVDLNPDPASASASGIGIYPTAWLQGERLIDQWYRTFRLPDAAEQSDDFGAVRLPPLSTAATSWLPPEIRQGRWSFDNRLPNACYGWEVFFHAPLLVADHLSKQQRFEDAERWLRLVFDPHGVEPGVPNSFLRFRVFREMPRGLAVGTDLKALAQAAANGSSSTAPAVDTIKALIAKWHREPFRPFVIARRRHVAYLWRTVFAYLDNLLAWADSLYRRDTREAIGEAAQLYALVARILGPRPRTVATRRAQAASSYADLAQKWDDFANAWFAALSPGQVQTGVPVGTGVSGNSAAPAPEGFLLFCIPLNDKLGTYWNLLEERLFNIRHCRNIEGIARELPLTAPSIDPGLLVRATAAGLDIATVVNGLFARPLPQRYATVAARALELAGDVRAFGAALLSATEKRDAEQLAQLRSGNEVGLLRRVSEVRTLQVQEAKRNIDALRASRAGLAARFEHLQRQLGNTDVRAPAEQETLGEESSLGRLSGGTAVQTSKWGLVIEEQRQLEEQGVAADWSDADSVAHIVSAASNISASVAALILPSKLAGIPEFLTALASASEVTAQSFRAVSAIHQTEASRQASSGSYVRRRDEWAHQSNQVLRELRQIDKQILANEIRVAVTEREVANHQTQLEQAEAIEAYLKERFSNADLYEWMVSELSGLHANAYRLAIDMARQAERASARELGIEPVNVIGDDHGTSRRSSLFAGERLHQDLRRLEIAHMEQSRREHEVTRHVSLRLLNPAALRALKTIGTCEFAVPEWLFDMDVPGHYMRRIKSVSLSIPCVVGPYTGIHAKLTLLRSDVRHSPSAAAPYSQDTNAEDPRFTTRFGATESMVTSNGRDDGGLFETNLRDERYLPFENEGAISRWRIEIATTYAQFDLETISDAVLHMRYTARDAGASLAIAAAGALATELQGTSIADAPLAILVSLKADFHANWLLWEQTPAGTRGPLTVKVSKELLPYWMRAASMGIPGQLLQWIALKKLDGVRTTADPPRTAQLLADGSVSVDVPDGSVDVLLIAKVRR